MQVYSPYRFRHEPLSKNLIHDADETPDPIKTRELTDEESARTASKASHSTRVHCRNGYWSNVRNVLTGLTGESCMKHRRGSAIISTISEAFLSGVGASFKLKQPLAIDS